jgi:hypothetical protein
MHRGGRAVVQWLLGALALPLAAAPTVAEEGPSSPAVQAARPSYPSLHIIGFTDLDFFASDDEARAPASGFSEGQFILHFTSALSPRFTFFGELSLSARASASVSAASTSFNADIERSIVRYAHSDHFKLSVGRYHTPISYWNVAFHHGQWLQSTVARPEMVQFGGSFVPVHFVGVLAEGAVPSRSLRLSYNLGLGNGRSSVLSRAGDAGDVNGNRAVIARLFARPDRPFGLEGGAAVYLDTISLPSGAHGERITSAYLAWTRETPEVIAEYVQVRHRPTGGTSSFTSRAYYAQVACRFPTPKSRWKPYARWEEIRVAKGDAVFADLVGRRGFLAGARFDAADLLAVKGEYRRQRSTGAAFVNGGYFQVSFSF